MVHAWQFCATLLVLADLPVHVGAQNQNTSVEGPQRLASPTPGPRLESFAASASAASAYSQEEAIKFAHLSAAAYCDRVTPEWQCGDHCKQVPGVHDVRKIDDHALAAHAYVARLDGQCLLAFRGTHSFEGWVEDLMGLVLEQLPDCSFRGRRCEVGRGFYDSFRAVSRRIREELAAIGCKRSSELAVTGHSRGAALAVLAAFDLRRLGYSVAKIYTFGQPRVGNAAFAGAFNVAFASTPMYRVTRPNDPVVHMPSQSPFHHVGTEVYYPGSSTEGYQVCDGSGEDGRCSDQNRPLGLVGLLPMIWACRDLSRCPHTNYLRPAMQGPPLSQCSRRLAASSGAAAAAPGRMAGEAPLGPASGAAPAPAILYP